MATDIDPTELTPKKRRRFMSTFFRDSLPEAKRVLVEIMSDVNAPHAARIAAAKEVLDRCFGKAPQYHEMSGPDEQPIEVRIDVIDKLLNGMEAAVREKGD